MTKRIDYCVFLSELDEQEVSCEISKACPTVAFLEGSSGKPARLDSISQAAGIEAWLSTKKLVPGASWAEMPPLMHITRCSRHASLLVPDKQEMRAGRFAMEYDEDEEVDVLVKSVRTVLRRVCRYDIERVDPVSGRNFGPERGVYVGPDAARWASNGGLLTGNFADEYFILSTKEAAERRR